MNGDEHGNPLLLPHEFSCRPAADRCFRDGAGCAGVRSRSAEEDRRTTGRLGGVGGAHAYRARATAEYFSGKRRDFELILDLRGTEFQRRCWNELLRIPFGETRSYAEIARAVGSPKSFRAVGQANHYNPVAIIVPCHRVLAAGCFLGGYGGGLPVKALLLRLEGAAFRERAEAPEAATQLAFSAS